MTLYEYESNGFELIWDSLPESKKKFIEDLPSGKGNLYCAVISFISNYLNGHIWFNSYYDEIDETEVGREVIPYSDAIYIKLKAECGIGLKKDICIKFVEYLKANKNNIQYYYNESNI